MCTLSQKVCTLCLSGSLIHVELSQVKLICIDLTPLTTQRASLDGQEKLTRNRKGRSHFPGIASTEGTMHAGKSVAMIHILSGHLFQFPLQVIKQNQIHLFQDKSFSCKDKTFNLCYCLCFASIQTLLQCNSSTLCCEV